MKKWLFIFLGYIYLGKRRYKIFIKEENQEVKFTAKHGIC